jgi:opacity protein-like surface antigen
LADNISMRENTFGLPGCRRFVLGVLFGVGCILLRQPATAEWYAGPYAGVNFADDLHNVQGTDGLFGLRAPDFDLKNSIIYGVKLGNYAGNSWFGVEGDVSNTTPHIKNLDEVPGIHMRLTTLAVNLMARYPGLSIQPYAGIGLALLLAHISDSVTTKSDSDVSPGFNAILGIRVFITPYVALFTEYKYAHASLTFNNAFTTGGGFQADYRAQYVVAGVTYHF